MDVISSLDNDPLTAEIDVVVERESEAVRTVCGCGYCESERSSSGDRTSSRTESATASRSGSTPTVIYDALGNEWTVCTNDYYDHRTGRLHG